MKPFLKQLAADYGTPFYAYDLDAGQARVRELKIVLEGAGASSSSLFYSFKANPLPSLAREFRTAGCEADLTSEGELVAAASAGFDPHRALYGGPGKSSAELAAAILAGVRQFSIESWQDLETLAATAEHAGVRVTGLLRVNPANPPRARVAMAGVASQFGFEESALVEDENARGRLAEFAGSVAIRGFHIYWGTQVGDVDALAASFESAIETGERLSARLDVPLEILNLGGGFPWPYAQHGESPNLTPLGAHLQRIRTGAGAARDAAWWFESGRYLAGSSGTLVTRVMDVKESKGRRYVILDSGINHLGGMTGLGRIPRFSIDLDPGEIRDDEETVDVVGQLCTPLDCLARNLKTSRLLTGDLVAIPNVGAYGLTASVSGFLSRPMPLEIACRGNEVESVHRLRAGHEQCTGTPPRPVAVDRAQRFATTQRNSAVSRSAV